MTEKLATPEEVIRFRQRAGEGLYGDPIILCNTIDDLREQLREAEDVADKAALDGYESGYVAAASVAESDARRLTATLRGLPNELHFASSFVHTVGKNDAMSVRLKRYAESIQRALAEGESDD